MDIPIQTAETVTIDGIGSETLHPILTIDEFRKIIGNAIKIDANRYIETRPIINITGDEATLFPQDSEAQSCNLIIHQFPNGFLTEVLDKTCDPQKLFIRRINLPDGQSHIILVKDPVQFTGEKLSRVFPIYGSPEGRKAAIQNSLNVNDDSKGRYFELVFNDRTFESLRKLNIVIVGGGTVGYAVANALSRIGVQDFSFFEVPTEKIELPNSQRLPNVGILEVDSFKWETMVSQILQNNPFANVKFLGAFDPSKNPTAIETLKQNFEDKKKPTLVFMALDNFPLRVMAHSIFEDTIRISPTDEGPNGLIQILKPNQSFEVPDLSKGFPKAIIQMLGGTSFVSKNFDAATVNSFFALPQAFGAFPQSTPSAIEAMIPPLVISMILGKPVKDKVFLNVWNRIVGAGTNPIHEENTIRQIIES